MDPTMRFGSNDELNVYKPKSSVDRGSDEINRVLADWVAPMRGSDVEQLLQSVEVPVGKYKTQGTPIYRRSSTS